MLSLVVHCFQRAWKKNNQGSWEAGGGASPAQPNMFILLLFWHPLNKQTKYDSIKKQQEIQRFLRIEQLKEELQRSLTFKINDLLYVLAVLNLSVEWGRLRFQYAAEIIFSHVQGGYTEEMVICLSLMDTQKFRKLVWFPVSLPSRISFS